MRTRLSFLTLALAVLGVTLPGPGGAAPGDPRAAEPGEAFAVRLTEITATCARLAAQWRAASGPGERARLREQARRYVVSRLTEEIFPAWMGTPWHMGEGDDASVPHEPGKRVSCSYFVTAALQNVGLTLSDRRAFAQSPALHIQRSLAPDPDDLARYPSVAPATFARAVAARGDGLYVVGLNCHVGFIRVQDGEARFIHSNYVDPETGVTDEPVATSQAIANSEAVGYWVTPLFQDDRLIEYWLEGRAVPLQRLGNVRKPFAATR